MALPIPGRLHLRDDIEPLPFAIYLALGGLMVGLGGALRSTTKRMAVAQSRLTLALEGTGIGVFDIDLTEKTAYASPLLAALTGIPAATQALPFSAWRQHLPKQLLSEHRQILQSQVAQNARSYEREVTLERAQGEPLVLLLRAHIDWAHGHPIRVRGACVDITEHRKAHTQLAAARAQLGQQLDDLGQLHELSVHSLATPELCAQLERVLSTLAAFHGATRGLVSLCRHDAADTGTKVSMGFSAEAVALADSLDLAACVLATRNKERVVIEDTETDPAFADCRALARREHFRAVHATPLLGAQGDMLGVLTVHLDEPRAPTQRERTLADICARKAALIIERARAREELLDYQGRFEAVLDASGAPFVVLEPVRREGQITGFRWTYVNRAAAQVLGRTPQELLGHEVNQTVPDRWPGSAELAYCVRAIEEQRTLEFDTVNNDGDIARWFHCIASPIRSGVAIWFTDISDRIRNEQGLRRSDQRKDEFLATLAHELRNPLAPIRQAAQLTLSPHATDAQKRWASEVTDRQVKHMALLLDDLFDVSRITRGALHLRKAPTALDDIMASAIETARPVIDAKGHHLVVHAGDAPIIMHVDPLRLAQVVSNLLTNAAKYTDAGGSIHLTVRQEENAVAIEVRDNGIGIEPAQIPAAFRMFAQLHQRGDAMEGGLGIGLALSKGLVELHGGTLTAHSDGAGQGSAFTVRLPMGPDRHAAPRQRSPMPAGPPPPRRILIADDNQDASDTLAALLATEGHHTWQAYDGDQALALWREFKPDVCLLDIGMPGRTGYHVAREIRASPSGEGTLLVAVTGWGQAHDRQTALDAGFDHHLIKPVNPAQISQLLGRLHRPEAWPLS